MSYSKIQAALDTHLQTYPGPVKVFPSTGHRLRHSEAFLASELIPGQVRTVFLGVDTQKEHRGQYRIYVRCPDIQSALSQIDGLRGHFPAGMELAFEDVSLRIDKAESIPNKGGLKFTNVPLSIYWRSYFKEN